MSIQNLLIQLCVHILVYIYHYKNTKGITETITEKNIEERCKFTGKNTWMEIELTTQLT